MVPNISTARRTNTAAGDRQRVARTQSRQNHCASTESSTPLSLWHGGSLVSWPSSSSPSAQSKFFLAVAMPSETLYGQPARRRPFRSGTRSGDESAQLLVRGVLQGRPRSRNLLGDQRIRPWRDQDRPAQSGVRNGTPVPRVNHRPHRRGGPDLMADESQAHRVRRGTHRALVSRAAPTSSRPRPSPSSLFGRDCTVRGHCGALPPDHVVDQR